MNYIREIFDTIEDNDLIEKDVAASLGISARQLDYVKKGERNFSFRNLLKIAFRLFPNKPHEMISKWSLEIETTKHVFEYAAITRNLPLLNELLIKNKGCTGVIQECLSLYGTIYSGMTSTLPEKVTLYTAISSLKSIKDETLLIIKELYSCLELFQIRKFVLMDTKLSELESRIKKLSDIKELFMKECLLHRLSELSSFSNLYLNKMDQARHYAKIVYNAALSNKTKSEALYVIGMSYINTDSEKCLKIMQMSYNEMILTGLVHHIANAKYNLQSAMAYLNRELPEDADPAVKIYQEFRKGAVSFEKAKEVIEDDGDADLLTMLLAFKNGNCENIYEQYRKLILENNYFLAVLLVKEAINLGDNSPFVKALLELHPKNQNIEKGEDLFEETYISSFNGGITFDRSICA